MSGRTGRRRLDPGSPLVDLDTVFADDAFIDTIAGQSWGGESARHSGEPAGRVMSGSSRGSLLTVDPLAELFQSWRQELADAPIPAPPNVLRTSAPVPRRAPSRSRSFRPALAIAAAIAALLVGAASIGSKDAPRESAMFALTQVLWPSRAESVASADRVDAILVEARTAIQDGRTQDAQLALLNATVMLGKVDDVDGKGDMQQKVADMWVEVAPEPADTPPRQSAATDRPTTPGTRSPTDNATAPNSLLAVLAARSAAGTVGVEQPAVVQLASPPIVGSQIVPPPPPATDGVLAALGPGWPTSQALAPPLVDVPAVTETAPPAASEVPVAPVVDVPPVVETTVEPPSVPSVPSTPPPPTAPVDPPAEIPTSDPPSATEQSPPAPTPSDPPTSVETTPAETVGPLTSEADASIQADPAAGGAG